MGRSRLHQCEVHAVGRILGGILNTSTSAIWDVYGSIALSERPSPVDRMTDLAGGPQLIAVLPAHNEASSITQTVWSLQAQTRPPDRIIVVCDNCTDETADLALLAGAEVMTTIGNTHKKAGALNQVLAQLLPYMPDTDQVLVMDADSSLNRGGLRRQRRRWTGAGRLVRCRGVSRGARRGPRRPDPAQRVHPVRAAGRAPPSGPRAVRHRDTIPGVVTAPDRSRAREQAARYRRRVLQQPVDHRGRRDHPGHEDPGPPVLRGRGLRDHDRGDANVPGPLEATTPLAERRAERPARLRPNGSHQRLLVPSGHHLLRPVRVGHLLGDHGLGVHQPPRLQRRLDRGHLRHQLRRTALDGPQGRPGGNARVGVDGARVRL